MSQPANRQINRSRAKQLARYSGLSSQPLGKLPKAGKLSASSKAKIDEKANRILGEVK